MNPIESYTFDNYTNLLIPYDGPGKRFRPVVKWLTIAYVVVIFGISTLLLREQSMLQTLGSSFPALACIAWLWHTRARTQEIHTPITVSFYQDTMVFDNPESVVHKRGRDVRRRVIFQIPYDTVTDVDYSLGMHEVTVQGTVETKIFNRDKDGVLEATPSWTRKGKGAAGYWTNFISPGGKRKGTGRDYQIHRQKGLPLWRQRVSHRKRRPEGITHGTGGGTETAPFFHTIHERYHFITHIETIQNADVRQR